MNVRRCAGAFLMALAGVGVSAVWGQNAVERLEKELDVPLVAPETATQAEAGEGYLGVSVDLAAPDGQAVFVTSVAEGGPAARAGLQADDVIVAIDDMPLRDMEDMDRAVRRPVGTRLVFQVRRGEALQTLEVTLGTRPAEAAPPDPVAELPEPARPDAAPSIVVEAARPSLGISVDDVSDLTRRRFAVTTPAGAVITRIRAGSPAARAGLPLGGVIVSVNGKRIGSADDLVRFIQVFRPGDEIELTYFEGDRIGRKKLRLAPMDSVTVPAPAASQPNAAAADRSDPPLQLGRRRLGTKPRPVLEALERTLDAVLPPVDPAGGADPAAQVPPPPASAPAAVDPLVDEMPIPPPPPAPGKAKGPAADPQPPGSAAPTPPPPPPAAGGQRSVLVPDSGATPLNPADELAALRRQAELLKQQLDQIQRRIEELEQTKRR